MFSDVPHARLRLQMCLRLHIVFCVFRFECLNITLSTFYNGNHCFENTLELGLIEKKTHESQTQTCVSRSLLIFCQTGLFFSERKKCPERKMSRYR